MNEVQLVPQLLGVAVLILFMIAPQLKTKTDILICHLIVNILVTIQFWMLGAIGGALLAIVTIFRYVVFLIFSVKGKTAPLGIMLLFVTAAAGCVAISFERPVDFLLLGAIANVYGMWQERLNVTRWCMLITVLSVGTYGVAYMAYTGTLSHFIKAGSVLIALWRYRAIKGVESQ